MRPTKFEGFTNLLGQPEGWDEETRGPCESLPVAFTEYGIYSRWKPTFSEAVKMLFGKPITLIVASSAMPPVSLQVTEPTEDK